VMLTKPSTWRTPGNAADLVIITEGQPKGQLRAAQALRRLAGLKSRPR